jgi:hypothetical protein
VDPRNGAPHQEPISGSISVRCQRVFGITKCERDESDPDADTLGVTSFWHAATSIRRIYPVILAVRPAPLRAYDSRPDREELVDPGG